MTISQTALPGVLLIEPKVFSDPRGWFMESYSKKKTPQITCEFVQDNHSLSIEKGTLRGIHFQTAPMEQAKLVRCVRGALVDFVIDIRPDSATFKQWFKVELSAENKKQLFIPKGYGHAFVTLTDNTEIEYKADNYYSSEHDGTILWSDPDLNIDWGFDDPILSDKDKNAKPLSVITRKQS